jgi:type I restriction enzyme S subunit
MFGNPILNDMKWVTEQIIKLCPIEQYSGVIQKNEDDKVWLLNLDMIESQTGTIIEKVYASENDIGNSTIKFSNNNVLYSKLRPYLNKVVLPNDNGYATSELVPFAPNNEINRYFLAYLLRSDSFVAFIDAKSGGAKMPRASMDVLRNFNLIKPPIELQNQFAEFVKLIDKSKFVGYSKYFL